MQVPQIQREMLSDEALVNKVDELMQVNPGCRILMFNGGWLEAIPADQFPDKLHADSVDVLNGLIVEIV